MENATTPVPSVVERGQRRQFRQLVVTCKCEGPGDALFTIAFVVGWTYLNADDGRRLAAVTGDDTRRKISALMAGSAT